MGVERHIPHYSSTPHLFVYQGTDEDISKEPIYSSAVDVRKETAKKEAEAVNKINRVYDTLPRIFHRASECPSIDPLAVTDEDVIRLETSFKGLKTQIWVCYTMANLYFDTSAGSSTVSWELRYTGVPVLILDSGNTKSRTQRRLQLILAEKGTGFALWRDVVDNLTSYKTQEPNFHTMYLSSDHRKRIGLSFNDGKAALEFYSHIERLTFNPSNISLSGPGKKNPKCKEKLNKFKPPRKTEISAPCNFLHITSVEACDKSRLFSLQTMAKANKKLIMSAVDNSRVTEV